MIEDGVTPHMRMLLSPGKRILFAAISLVVFGLILLACSSFAQAEPAIQRTAYGPTAWSNQRNHRGLISHTSKFTSTISHSQNHHTSR